MYHRIATEQVDPWGLAVSPARFVEQVEWLQGHRAVLPLTEFARLLRDGRLPVDAVAITVDDGYACNATTAAPILEAHRAPATFFVTTEPISAGQEFWWDELQRIVLDSSVERIELATEPRRLVFELGDPPPSPLGWHPGATPSTRRQEAYLELWNAVRALPPADQAAALADLRLQAGVPSVPRDSHRPMSVEELRGLTRSEVIDLGCHTATHPSLPLQAAPVQRAEIEASRETAARLIGRSPVTFAYPFGDYDSSTVDLVREAGYEAACTTDEGGVSPGCDVLALPRLQVMDWSAGQLARRLRVL
jgi:peptidoglycan/xylan/chitin deacetylase (PgdA/CDA1 family)